MNKNTQLTAVFAFGVVFVTVLLVSAICFPEPTQFQYTVFRVILALSAAGVAALIPGFLSVDITPATSVAIRASGALAVFLVVYFFPPAPLPAHLQPDIEGQERGAPRKIHDVQVTDLRFLDSDPEGAVSPAPMFNRMQLTITNKGSATSVVARCSLNLIDFWCVSPVTGLGGIIEPSATYHINLLGTLERQTAETAESFLVNLAPDETVSVEVVVDSTLQVSAGAGASQNGPCNVGDEPAFLGQPGWLEPILLASLELQLDSGETIKSPRFCFTLPNRAVLGSRRLPLVEPMEWLENLANNRIGGMPVVKSVMKMNLSRAPLIRGAADLRSPQVDDFLRLMGYLEQVRECLD